LNDTAQVVIVGGGVVGLAVAAELASRTPDVFLIEARPRFGLGASTRNSGVLHAGIYYRPGSLKAFHCVRGRRMLYDFCASHRVPCLRTGKLIVGDSTDDLAALGELKARGEENGVEGLEIVYRAFIREREPEVVSPVALYSPGTGVIDAEALVRTLARLASERGAHLIAGTPLLGVDFKDGLFHLRTPRETVAARAMINVAGLYADDVARMCGETRYTIYPCRGEYAEVIPSRSHLVRGSVYPLPLASGHGLGVHFTKTVAGTLLLGPNARYVEGKENYESDRAGLGQFYESARRIVPALRSDDLRHSYTGLRARLRPEHDHSFADFVLERDARCAAIIHAIGIESPGLTSSLSLAVQIADMVGEWLA
jgi:glycerol-3-phosphate dehydrogenase